MSVFTCLCVFVLFNGILTWKGDCPNAKQSSEQEINNFQPKGQKAEI